eukprot:Hpha_TRINITY_DN16172_c0_g1::TRINITY_DN16172_c0_g1_i2::g.7776::m.7776
MHGAMTYASTGMGLRRSSSLGSRKTGHLTSPRNGSFRMHSLYLGNQEQDEGDGAHPPPPSPVRQGRRKSHEPIDDTSTSWSVKKEEQPKGRPVTGHDLIKILEQDARRIANYSAAPLFFMFLILYTASCTLIYGLDSRGSVRLMQVSIREDVFHEPQFREIREANGFYNWLREVVQKNLFCQTEACINESSGLSQGGSAGIATSDNLALNFMLLRQYRQSRSSNYCRNNQLFPLNNRLRMRINDAGCATGYGDVGLSDTVYGSMPASLSTVVSQTTDPFQPDSAKAEMPRTHWVEGDDTFYGDRDKHFSVMLPFDLLVQNVTSVIDAMQAGSWIDDQTKALLMVVQFCNPAKGEYLVLQFVLEFSITGDTDSQVNALPFWFFIRGEDGLRSTLFALDIAFTLYLVFILRDCIRGCIINSRLERFPLGIGEALYLFHFLLMVATLGLRFHQWREGGAFGSNMSPVDMFTEFNEFAYFFQLEHTFATVALAVAWARVLEQLKFTRQLNAVTETLRLGAADLVSLSLIFSIIVVGFATLGQHLYGYHVQAFDSFGASLRILTVWVFTADIQGEGVLDEMMTVQPWLTLFYVAAYVLLSWLLLLNIVLGILAAAFAAASATTEDRRWTWTAIVKELSAPFCPDEDDEEDPVESPLPDVETSSTDNSGHLVKKELNCAQNCSQCLWPWLFLSKGGQRGTYNRLRCIKVLRALAGEEGLNPRMLEMDQKRLLSRELRERGWSLQPSATSMTMTSAVARVPEDFAQAEQDRQEQVMRIVSDVLSTRAEVLSNRRETIDRTQVLEELIRELLSKVGHYHIDIGNQISSQLSQSKEMESSLRQEVHLSKDEVAERLARMGDEVNMARKALLKELTKEGERLMDFTAAASTSSSPNQSPDRESPTSLLSPSLGRARQLSEMLLERALEQGTSKDAAASMRRVANALNRTNEAVIPNFMRRTISSQLRKQERRSSSLPSTGRVDTPPQLQGGAASAVLDRKGWR